MINHAFVEKVLLKEKRSTYWALKEYYNKN